MLSREASQGTHTHMLSREASQGTHTHTLGWEVEVGYTNTHLYLQYYWQVGLSVLDGVL